MAESELMAENVPEAVQRLSSGDNIATSSTSMDVHIENTNPALTSPTGVAVSAADAYSRMSAGKDEDSDSEYGLEFNPYSFVRTLPPLSEVLPLHHKLLLPPQTRRFSRKTLVLDLDETLVSLCICAAPCFPGALVTCATFDSIIFPVLLYIIFIPAMSATAVHDTCQHSAQRMLQVTLV